jgi:hypothetical protein
MFALIEVSCRWVAQKIEASGFSCSYISIGLIIFHIIVVVCHSQELSLTTRHCIHNILYILILSLFSFVICFWQSWPR